MTDFNIIKKLATGRAKETLKKILTLYQDQWYAVINYLYGANIVTYKLLEHGTHKYKSALLHSDFLLPDGIALRTMWLIWSVMHKIKWPRTISNLNGTDFVDYILQYLTQANYCINLSVYCNYDPKLNLESWYLIEGAQAYLQKHYHISISYAVDKLYWWADTRDRKQYDSSIDDATSDHTYKNINILLVCTGTPHQEQRVHSQIDHIQSRHLLVLTQWGTLDFWSGKEIRAPKIIRLLHIEFVRRALTYPKKNLKKSIVSLKMMRLIIKHMIIGQ
jgi:exopolysaccharide biosynthesis WecB/TagA/CpsF family protein